MFTFAPKPITWPNPTPEFPADASLFDKVSGWITALVFYGPSAGGEVDIRLVVIWLITAAIFFTIWLGFLNVRGFKHALDLVRGKYSDPDDAGEVSHFQALATAVSGTVGLGNIAGVAIAISIGGPGATFWMIVAGFLGMSLKAAECMLGVKFRQEHADGTVSGGPMYYLRDGLRDLGRPGLGKVLAVVFAFCMIGGAVGGGNMFQSNQATAQIVSQVGGEDGFLGRNPWIIGVIFAGRAGRRHHRRHQEHREGDREGRPVHGGPLPHRLRSSSCSRTSARSPLRSSRSSTARSPARAPSAASSAR